MKKYLEPNDIDRIIGDLQGANLALLESSSYVGDLRKLRSLSIERAVIKKIHNLFKNEMIGDES